jgi:hypothetical protein
MGIHSKNLLKLAYIFEKGRLEIKQRIDLYFFAISIKTREFRFLRMAVISPFNKIKSLKKIMPNSYSFVFIRLGCIQPKTNRIDPVMNFGLNGICHLSHIAVFI